ncbi:hypothetical protein VF21_10623 [Pseudogymnoascus sp. 05NY08]|nr:hypothetical protein VF21_10623 [Pseudogymnoascus sp. 05NY08]
MDNDYKQDISDITYGESLIGTDDDLAGIRFGAMSETPQAPIALLSSHSGSTPSSYDSLSLVMLSTVPDMHSEQDKSLLNHYMKVVAGVLSKCESRGSNPYLTKILPMALSNQLIMGALLAMSASHWKKLQPAVWESGTKHKTNTLQSLAKLLPHLQMDSANIALAATLMLCMIELLDGTSSHWKYHLDGARQLLFSIDRQSEWRECGDLIAFYRGLYYYLDSATTISTCHPPLLETPKDTDLSSSEQSPQHGIDDEEALYGVPKELFRFIDKVNGLAYQRKYRDDPVFENMFRASADTLEKELEYWRQNYFDIINASQLEIQATSDEEAQHATIAYEQAIQLRLHQVLNGYSLQHNKVQECVSKILKAVQEIRYGSPFENCLVFPLTMAGSSCQSESDRLIIGDRFLVMERTVGFGYIYTAYDLVQRVWKQRDLCKGTVKDVNWAEIRYYQIPGLVLI